MDQRYLLAIPFPDDARTELEAAYMHATGESIAVKTLHVSLEFPLFLANHVREDEFISRVHGIAFEPFTAQVSRIGIFTQQERKIVHVKLQPAANFEQLHDNIRRELGEYYQIDTSVFTNGVVPLYDPHITLGYNVNFSEDVLQKLHAAVSGISFHATRVAVYKEIEKGRWEIL